MRYNSTDDRIDYFPPLVGNGSIVFNVGYNGTMISVKKDGIKSVFADNYIWWAGRRYFDRPHKELVPFGIFEEIFKLPLRWSQELIPEDGIVKSECEYDDGKVYSEVFVHHDYNLIALRKTFTMDAEYSFVYKLQGKENPEQITRRINITDIEAENGFSIDYVLDGYKLCNGRISVFSDKPVKCEHKGNQFILQKNVKAGEAICFYIILDDDFEESDYKSDIARYKEDIFGLGFDEMLQAHRNRQREYFDEGYAEFDDEVLTNTYKMAQYALKCQMTKWSISPGLNNISWEGRYFAFDEYFSFYALLTSNHKGLARRVPEFRHKGLGIAVSRATYVTQVQAHYPWETLEDGTEDAVLGAWMDHIFHMSHIACGVFEYYRYSNDIEFLKEKYEVMYACANYFLQSMIYTLEGGKVVIGKCTDLERLGASQENAYMTTCSVIKTLRMTHQASEILETEKEFSDKCQQTAAMLLKNLPKNNNKYEPYPGCKQKSIAVFTGSWPYNVIAKDDICQKNAMKDYILNEAGYGNCYSVGKGVSTWYAGIKAAAFANIDNEDDAYVSLQQAIANIGCFCECFEINEKENALYRPWFTTASGTLISAINTMLIRREGNTIFILPAFGKNVKDIKLKLAVENAVVELVVEDKKLVYLNILSDKAGDLECVLHEDITDMTGMCKIIKGDTKHERCY